MTGPIKTEGVIFHLRRHSETSLIVEWWTKEQGIIHTMAKGALRPGARAFSGLDLFQKGELSYRPAKRSRLHTLIEFQPISHHAEIRSDYTKLLAAAYAYDLTRHFVEGDAPLDDVYQLMCKFLDFLNTQPIRPTHVQHLENRLFGLLGLGDLNLFLQRQSHHPNPHHLSSFRKLDRQLRGVS
jgi:DNA repair protein RecO